MRAAALLLPLALMTGPAPSSDARLVNVDVLVYEKDTGRLAELLGPRDFVILDEGEPREVKAFQIETTSLDVVFLLYAKGYVRFAGDGSDVFAGLREAIDELRPSDRGAILRSDTNAGGAVQLMEDKRRIDARRVRGRGRVRPMGRGDRLYDAVASAMSLFPKPYDPTRRRAIIALTDDIERHSRIKLDPLTAELLEGGATLNTVVLVTGQPYISTGAATIPIPTVMSRRIGGTTPTGISIQPAVEATGGERIPGDKSRAGLPEMLRRLHGRYLLGFQAPASGDRRVFRRIEVRLTEEARKRYPSAVIRARTGYYTVVAPARQR